MKAPNAARRLLLLFLRDDLAEEVTGDLDEKFQIMVRQRSVFRARLNYWYQVLHYVRPFAIRKSRPVYINQSAMLQNYFKIGIRNLLKNKMFSIINISGMAISMIIFLVMSLFIFDELRFDQHIEDVDLKFRVYNELFSDDGSMRKASMIPPPVAPALASEYPEIEYYTRYLNFNYPPLFEVGERKFTENSGGCADPSVFNMFSMELLEGDRTTALTEPNTVAISHTLRKKYFDDNPALGETIEIFNQNFKVVAVFEDFPSHSHFQRNFFLAINGIVSDERMQNWGWSQFHTYVKLTSGADVEGLEAKLEEFAKRKVWPDNEYIPHLMPMKKVHLYASDHVWDVAVRGNIQTVYILSAAAIFVLIIAILNFVNLSTARAVNRMKEVGLRKVMGAFRVQLVHQFIGESVLVAVIAFLICIMATSLVLPALNSFTGKSIPAGIFIDPVFLGSLFVIVLVIGFAAGAYPAFYISSYKPVQILAGKSANRSGKTLLRKGLVVFQFMLSFFLIIASLVVRDQHTYMRTTDMGFDKDNLVVIRLRGDMTKNLEATKNLFADHPSVISATLGYGLPGEAYAGDGIIDKATGEDMHTNMLTVDHDYPKTLGLEFIAGRDFSKDFPSDEKHAFVISEAAGKMLGYPDPAKAIGHPIGWKRWDAPDSVKEGEVIGVIKDIQLNSMREEIAPVILHVFPFGYSSMTLRIKPENVPATIQHMEKSWKAFNSEWPFEYKFLDENFDRMYKDEERLSTLFTVFTVFTIFVACLGLFGLVSYSTSQRYKEISIRKVLGAAESAIVVQLSGNYAVLISLAFVAAFPFSYFFITQWLDRFAFKIPITPFLFIKAGLSIVIMALLTVSIQSIRAARANPIDALKEQ